VDISRLHITNSMCSESGLVESMHRNVPINRIIIYAYKRSVYVCLPERLDCAGAKSVTAYVCPPDKP